MVVLCGRSQEIGYVETFSLAGDRATALNELVPGTDDYYYYHALHAQNSGAGPRFQEVLDRWIRERNGTVTPTARELLNRQALLDYEKEPKKSLDYLRRELGLYFNHARKTGERVSQALSVMDNIRISSETLLKRALTEEPRSLERIEDAGLALAAGQIINDEQRRNLVSRLRRPDYPGLADLIIADLKYRDSRGFGSHPIHALLTLAQMDELLQKQPILRNEMAFVNAYLSKLAPENEIDLDTSAFAREAYFDRVWTFVKTLDPVHNSLKANVLYNRLRHDRQLGVVDLARFMEYVKLPRNVVYCREEIRKQLPRGDYLAQLEQDFHLVCLPPVNNEEPLVRAFLLEILREAADYEAFRPYVSDYFLKPLFAEAKIVNGVGDPQQWASLLSPDAYKQLKDRVDIDFSETNPLLFGSNDEVKLTAFVKNVPALIVKVYEINTFNYYREKGQPLNLAINLDGLVASASRRVEYKEITERRVGRTFELPELKGRGVFVVELIGNGKSSRALVQKGRLDTLQEVTAAGHSFTVLDEMGKPVTDASGWLGGRDFTPDKEGRILVPFTTEPKSDKLVIRKDGFATLVSFKHLPENYALKAGIYVDREALIRREKALIAVRPVFTVNSRPVSLKLLEEPCLVIRSTDLHGIATEKEVAGLVLREDAENVQEILVPENTIELSVTLKAKVQNLSQSKKQDLSYSASFTLNGIERTVDAQTLHFGRSVAGYSVDARGKNGEILPGEPLQCFFKHRCFRDEVFMELKTDAQGRAQLGPLVGIERFRIKAASGVERTGTPSRGACAYPEALHGWVGDTLRVPITCDATDAITMASLLETRNGQFVKDWQSALASADGFLELRGLPAGDYSLFLKAEGREITVRVTQGEARDGFVVSPHRALERPRLAPLNVTSITSAVASVEIQLSNVTPFTRVHVFATRYLPAYDLFGRLGYAGTPGLLQQPWLRSRTFYESGRDIGDEYRYIIDRQQTVKYPGNMLERPGLLLNPWALRATEAQAEMLEEGRAYAGRASGLMGSRISHGGGGGGMLKQSEGYLALDFLKQPAVTLLNLVPNKEGRVTVSRALLKGLPQVRVLAVDPTTTVLKHLALEDSPIETRELRLASGLDPKKSFSEQKRITPVATKADVTVADVTTARFETYDTLAKAYRLLATLNSDATFGEFSFVAEWPSLDAKEQRRLYSKYACHEFSFFLYHKDPKFFASVIAPSLKNKKDKTFMDHWLLNDDLAGYLEPWRFGRLNAVERVLLGKRMREQEASVGRDTRERVALILPDMEAFNRRFDTAVQSGSLDAGGGGVAAAIADIRDKVALKIQVPKPQFTGTPKDIRSANLEASRGPASAPAPVVMEVAKKMKEDQLSNSAPGITRQRALSRRVDELKDSKAEEAAADAFAMDKEKESVYFEAQDQSRADTRRFFQKLDKTQEWAENNYYHVPITQQVATLVKDNSFWGDYATHDNKTPFLSKAFPETATNFTEMMLALAVLELPFKAAAHDEKVEGLSYTLKPKSPLLLFHREICESARETLPGGVLVAQQFFRADDRERIENGERFDKLVTEEFLPGVVYGAQVVLTNPTGSRQKLQVLLQIPVGAMPVNTGFYTRGVYVAMEPYSTQTQEYFFYFPTIGDYPHYPVTLARNDKVVGNATPFTFHVVEKLSKIDTTSWAWISQNGTEDEVLVFLGAANLHRISLDEIAWRMKDAAYFKKVTALLEARHLYANTLWSYGVLHNDTSTIKEFLRHHPFADQCGLWLVSPLLKLDPEERFDYQHLEYAPLVNPRAHGVGAKRTILNASFRQQYQRYMKVLSYKPKVESVDALAVAYYMTLQDRVTEALEWFGRVDRKTVPEQLQCDYLEAYLAFYKGDTATARKVAKKHADEGVDRWHDRFVQMLSQLDEIDGGVATKADQEKRDEAQAALAASEPVLELQVEAGRIRLDTRNLKACTLNFYPMDIELLFSRSPFLQEGAAQFSYIRPMLSRVVELPAGKKEILVDLPDEFKTKNVMVEAVAAGVRKTQAYYANTLKVQMIESYGQLLVTQAQTGKPVSGAYVKVYAKMNDNTVKFFKDGYTDLRGRFDYVSLNTNELEDSQRLAVLVLSDAFGAVVREAPPPKR
jgi:5-hydroxyisourate hydrolase-like protein (transthyretin family)